MNSRRTALFLDIDGVLNCQAMTVGYTCEEFHKLKDHERHLYGWNIKQLNTIVEETGCDVILSSTWRLGKNALEYTQGELEKQGFKYKLKDKTGRCCSGVRGVEIANYLNKSGIKYIRYAILDDDDDFLIKQSSSFFQVDYWVGLTPSLANRVINHLNSND